MASHGLASRYSPHPRVPTRWEIPVDRDELKAKIEELMRQYEVREIDGPTYIQKMMELTTSAQG